MSAGKLPSLQLHNLAPSGEHDEDRTVFARGSVGQCSTAAFYHRLFTAEEIYTRTDEWWPLSGHTICVTLCVASFTENADRKINDDANSNCVVFYEIVFMNK